MGHYKANVRDLEFNLFEWLKTQNLMTGESVFEEIDEETARDMLSQAASLCENDIAESLLDSDRNPPVYDPEKYQVSMPESFVKSYQAYVDSEFWRMGVHEDNGGTVVPPSFTWAISELVLGSNPAIHMYSAGFAFSRILYNLGNEDQKKVAQMMVDRKWGSTMVLTEPDAGSDVGAGRAKAIQQEDGTWHIEGVKRFITSAANPLAENVIHLVLARPEGAGPGTKGLSLFMVPEHHFDPETGDLGERNGVFVTNVEHKMGLKVSTTCELRFGEIDNIPAVGTLVGDVHEGIAQMFKVIESARMMVGTKAIATLSTGYLNALDYAKERLQGADLTQMADKTAPRVPIIRHPDVRRSLMMQKSYAEGLRALMMYTAHMQDEVGTHGGLDLAKEPEKGSAADLPSRINDLLLPLVKGVGSERAWVLLGTESLQTYGGSGFLQDYPIEQYVRDAKIDTLYEGTTAIQGMDFFFRKIVKDQGDALGHLANKITEVVKGGSGDDQFKSEREALGTALEDVQGMIGSMVNTLMSSVEEGKQNELYKVGLNTTRLLMGAGDLIIGWLLLEHATIAAEKLNSDDLKDSDKAFYEGKVASARFFTRNVLPLLTAERQIVESTPLDVMEMDDNAF